MATIQQLVSYFSDTCNQKRERRMGAEIETFFLNKDGAAISLAQSQEIFTVLLKHGWNTQERKGDLITEMRKDDNKILYELGYPNLELSVGPRRREELIPECRGLLRGIYEAAAKAGAFPLFEPIFEDGGNYLAIPDERDATWLTLDGKSALTPLARISAVQFTVDVSPEEAIPTLNRLNLVRARLLAEYPQDRVWKSYIRDSNAGYREDRYGGPASFSSLWNYCQQLATHDVVCGAALVPFKQAYFPTTGHIDLFLRSVWWYFRLRRYGQQLCVEVRPLARRGDEALDGQLADVLAIINE